MTKRENDKMTVEDIERIRYIKGPIEWESKSENLYTEKEGVNERDKKRKRCEEK